MIVKLKINIKLNPNVSSFRALMQIEVTCFLSSCDYQLHHYHMMFFYYGVDLQRNYESFFSLEDSVLIIPATY